jgi:hypothetical protein
VLTQKGREFFPVLAALQRWGDRWLADEAGPPVVLHHERCGHDGEAEVVCSTCGGPMTSADTSLHIGPGYPERLTHRDEVRQRFGLQPVPCSPRENAG